MLIKIKHILLTTLLILLLPVWAGAATYTAYFADDGTDNIVGTWDATECTVGDPCNTLAEAQKAIDDVLSTDTMTLYFARGDTWSMDTAAVQTAISTFALNIGTDDPIVHIDAYGAGAKPCFDGLVTDFSAPATPSHNLTTGPVFWSQIFKFSKADCSMSNVEIKQMYGKAILLYGSDNFTLDSCEIHDFGAAGVSGQAGLEDCHIKNNLVYNGELLIINGKKGRYGWGAGISMFSEGWNEYKNNTVEYNVVYNIAGEGIINAGGINQFNVVGDTYSVGLYLTESSFDAQDSIVRYNLVISSDDTTYRGPFALTDSSSYIGICTQDEQAGGDNSSATHEIYGNIVINRYVGIKVMNVLYPGEHLGEVRIYNNTVIDSRYANYVIAQPEEFNAGYIYNNSSIRYDTARAHVGNLASLPHANWTVDNNHFYPVDGTNTVDDGWTTNYVTGDPKLLGEELDTPIDWDGQTGATYFSDIDFNEHLYLAGDSALINAGKDLNTDVDASYNDDFLTYGTNFGSLPVNETFVLADQDAYLPWDIGAVVYPHYPQNLPPEISASSVLPTVVANEGTLTYSVTATDPESLPLTYSWRINGVPFSTSASSTYVLPAGYNNSAVKIYCQVCDPTNNCVNTSTYSIQVGTVGETTVSFGENTADTYTGVTSDTIIGSAGPDADRAADETLSCTLTSTSERNSLIQFDLTALAGETLSAVSLKIEVYNAWTGATAQTIGLYDCVDAYVVPVATWNCARDDDFDGSCDVVWTGGDHGLGTLRASEDIDDGDVRGTVIEWDDTDLRDYLQAKINALEYDIRFILVATSAAQAGWMQFVSSEGANGDRPVLYVTYNETVESGNDFDEANCDNWWKLVDGTDSKGTDDLSSGGDPSFAGSIVTLDGNDYLYLADLTADRDGDFSVFVENFHFDVEIADNTTAMLASEWDSTGVGAAKKKCWYIGINDDSGGGADDEVLFSIGSNSGEDTNATLDTSFDLVAGTSYDVIATYDNTNDDVHIYLWNTAGTAQQNTDPNDTCVPDINAESVQFNIGRTAAGFGYLTGALDTVTLFDKELTADEAQAAASGQYPVASIVEIKAVTPDTTGTVGIGDTFVISIEFDKPVTWTDAALPYAYVEVETGGTDLALYHSSPATTVADTIHFFSTHATDANYVNSMIAAGMTSADAALITANGITLNGGTFQYGSPAIDAVLTLPTEGGDHGLSDNADIVIDTDSPGFHANSPYLCNSSGTQITANTEYTTAIRIYIALESDDSTNYLFNEGSLGELYLTVRMLPADRKAYYYSGIGTSKMILYCDLLASDRAITGKDTEVIVTTFTNGSTKLIDAGGNEFDYTLDHTWLIDANTLKVNIPGVFTIGSGGDYPLWSNGSTGFHDVVYDLDTDKFNVLDAFADDIAISADNVRIRGTGRNVAITGGITLTGNNTIIKCLTFSGGITDNGNDYVYQENCQGGLID